MRVVPQPTHCSSSGISSYLIDAMSVPSQLVNCCSVIPPLVLGDSNHNRVNVTLKWSCNVCPVKASKRTIWWYVVCITKTWLCDDIGESEVSIPGYNCVRCDRNRHGGGVALFISDKLEYQVTMYGQMNWNFCLYLYIAQTMLTRSVYWLMVPATC